jgi:hypothetical protein
MCKDRRFCKFYLHDLFVLDTNGIDGHMTELAVRVADTYFTGRHARLGLVSFGMGVLRMQIDNRSAWYDVSFCSVLVILWRQFGKGPWSQYMEPESISSDSIEDALDGLVVRVRTHSSVPGASCTRGAAYECAHVGFVGMVDPDLQPLLGGAEEELCDGRLVEWSGERLQSIRVFANDEIIRTEYAKTAVFVVTAHDLQRRLEHDELHEDPLAWDAPASAICERALTVFPVNTHVTCYARDHKDVRINMFPLRAGAYIIAPEHEVHAACDIAGLTV